MGAPNKAYTGQVGFCGTLRVEHFAQRGFGFFLLRSRVHARSPADNAHR